MKKSASKSERTLLAEASRTPRAGRTPRASAVAIRQAILQAALEAFASLGFEGASTRQIAKAAGIKQGHLVYYYPSKESLWRAVAETFSAECKIMLTRELTPEALDKPYETAQIVLPLYVRFMARHHRLSRLMLQEFSMDTQRRDWAVENLGKPMWGLLRPLFEALARGGLLACKEPVSAYTLLLGGSMLPFSAFEEIHTITGVDSETEAFIADHTRLLVSAILRDPTAR